MHINERLDDHQKFRELAVLAQRGAISDIEQLELNNHLRVCRACRQVYDEYSLISTVGVPFLAASIDSDREAAGWDDRPARNRLMARVRRVEEWDPSCESARTGYAQFLFGLHHPASRWGFGGLAACVLVAIAAGMYTVGARSRVGGRRDASIPNATLADLSQQNNARNELIAAQKSQLESLQSDLLRQQQETVRLKLALQAAENHAAAISASSAKTEERLHEAAAQRDKLIGQLRDAEQSYQILQAELTSLRADHEKTLLHTASLQTRVDDLEASARDQERRLKDDEQYLSSDRDIRELMGARKLYIADVFDVDSGSRTRKPFGRVFYTQNKSLIFYAFDLDHQPGVKNASAFQVWGQRDGAPEQSHATNLGILYMDSESNRRWVLKIDDPKQLSEIDAVFVTIEPHGGSHKPTGKPFLYALLRREANHP